MVPYPELPPKMISNQKTSLELGEVEELVLTISEEEESELLDSAAEGSSTEETSAKTNSLEGRSIVKNIDFPVTVLDWSPPDYVPQQRNCKSPCLHPLGDGCGKLTVKQRLGPPVNICVNGNNPKTEKDTGKNSPNS